MPPLNVQRIRLGAAGADAQLAALRDRLGTQGSVVSPRGAALTVEVFGAPLTPAEVVERVCGDVRSRGLEALLHYTEKFDRVKLAPDALRVAARELADAHAAADPALLETVRRVRKNVMAFQTAVLHQAVWVNAEGLRELGLRYRPVRRVGVHIPGGAAAYPSTLLMTVVPAQAAGVQEVAVVMPPGPNGAGNPTLLAVCHELGVTEVFRVGGAQAIAALAYGVDGLPAVDMVVGPGNLFVALAKRHVFGRVAIDCIAGPSEVVVLADHTARANFVAADLLAQAEHSPGASVLVTPHEPLLDAVAAELEAQLGRLERADLTRDSLERFGALVLARTLDEAIEATNRLAPEHLEVMTADDRATADRVDNAGAIFLGPYSPVAVGDYAAGPSHTLPTGGTSRFASGLSSCDFLKRTSVLSFTRRGLAELAPDVVRLAGVEGLTAHAASVRLRTE